MKTADFSYRLPPERIAQHPAQQRDGSRLMTVDRSRQTIAHGIFPDVLNHIHPGDLLVINDTRVIPARLWCRKTTGARIELLFTSPVTDTTWRASAKPQRRLRAGMALAPEASPETRLLVDAVDHPGAGVTVSLQPSPQFAGIEQLLQTAGGVPLPPYVDRDPEADDRERYQTVYAREPGAIAAPTAGLHFTPELLDRIRTSGAAIARVTLHVGLGTFRPVSAVDPRDHAMHEERYELPAETVSAIASTKERGGRIVAVGTTTVRVLEHCAGISNGRLAPSRGSTRLLILPGHRFQVADSLITNFHLPESTLLMLVSAFASRELILRAYEEAVRERYRFFSYGDAMMIV